MEPQDRPAQVGALLDFWFGPPDAPEGDRSDLWFTIDPTFDAALRERFLTDYEAAAAGQYEGWKAEPETCLALILLLDQLPRNLFRGTPRAYATDGMARAAARHAVERGFDQALAPIRRWFVYLPFEHSEDLADQELALRLFRALPEEARTAPALAAVERHHEIITRFGRFPHRNRVLGRVSTPEEEAFLKEPNSAF